MNSFIFLLLFFFLTAPSAYSSPKIVAGAAISMKDALEKVTETYTLSDQSKKVSLTFGSTATIVRQIENKANIDVFVSADKANIDRLITSGFIHSSEVVQIATNEILLVVAANSSTPATAQLFFKSFLADAHAGRLAICQPNVPIGNYAAQILKKLNIKNDLGSRTVTADNVRAALSLVLNGAAKAAFVYRTDFQLHSKKLRIIPLPQEAQITAKYYAAPIKTSANEKEAKEFVGFLSSESAQKNFSQFGFHP